jgi:hypothetical protein
MLGIAHGDLRLLGHGNPFHGAPDKQLLCWCWKSVLNVATEHRRFFTRYALQHSGFPLSELVWLTTTWLSSCCSWMLLLHNNSTYGGSSNRAEIWRTDLLVRWHPMTVPRWKSLSSTVIPLLSMLGYGDCMAVCSILYSCQQQVWLK